MNFSIPELSGTAKSIAPGRYRHFKGGEYEVLGVGWMSEDAGLEMVVYRSLDNGNLWIRPVAMFLENMEREDYKGPRFYKI